MTKAHATLADTTSTSGLCLSFLFFCCYNLAKMLGADTINLYELIT